MGGLIFSTLSYGPSVLSSTRRALQRSLSQVAMTAAANSRAGEGKEGECVWFGMGKGGGAGGSSRQSRSFRAVLPAARHGC